MAPSLLLFAGAKIGFFLYISKLFLQKLHEFQKKALPLHSLLRHRDVAQLVAHYVRDVGVGRSSRLIPTKSKTKGLIFSPFVFGRTPKVGQKPDGAEHIILLTVAHFRK